MLVVLKFPVYFPKPLPCWFEPVPLVNLSCVGLHLELGEHLTPSLLWDSPLQPQGILFLVREMFFLASNFLLPVTPWQPLHRCTVGPAFGAYVPCSGQRSQQLFPNVPQSQKLMGRCFSTFWCLTIIHLLLFNVSILKPLFFTFFPEMLVEVSGRDGWLMGTQWGWDSLTLTGTLTLEKLLTSPCLGLLTCEWAAATVYLILNSGHWFLRTTCAYGH